MTNDAMSDKNDAMSDKLELIDLALSEIQALAARPPILLRISPLTLFVAISHLQLAFRHPQNDGPSREIAERFVSEARAAITERGSGIDTIIEMGFNEFFDTPREGPL